MSNNIDKDIEILEDLKGKMYFNNENVLECALNVEEQQSLSNVINELKRIKSLDINSLVEDWETGQFIAKDKVVNEIDKQIQWLKNDIDKTKVSFKMQQEGRYIDDYRKARLKAFNTKSKEFISRLEKLKEQI